MIKRQYLRFDNPIRARILSVLILLVLSTPCLRAAEYRRWTSSTGIQVEAKFKELKSGEVFLIDKEGKTGRFQLYKFSEPDQKYIKDLNAYLKRKERGETVTAPIDPRSESTPANNEKSESQKAKPAENEKQKANDPLADAVKINVEADETKKESEDKKEGESEKEGEKKKNVELPDALPITFPLRTWKDIKGRSIEGKLFSASSDRIFIIKKDSDKFSSVPIANLSERDREYLTIQLKALGRNDLLANLSLQQEQELKPAAKPQDQLAAANPPAAQVAPPQAAPPANQGNPNRGIGQMQPGAPHQFAQGAGNQNGIGQGAGVAPAFQHRIQQNPGATQPSLADEMSRRNREWVAKQEEDRKRREQEFAASLAPRPAPQPQAEIPQVSATPFEPKVPESYASSLNSSSNSSSSNDDTSGGTTRIRFHNGNGIKWICGVIGSIFAAIAAFFRKLRNLIFGDPEAKRSDNIYGRF